MSPSRIAADLCFTPLMHRRQLRGRSLSLPTVISTTCRELFVDGYDPQGNRVYDKVEGQTCHQCRQKTMGKRTSCSKCQSLSVRPRPCLLLCFTSFITMHPYVLFSRAHSDITLACAIDYAMQPSSMACCRANVSQHPPGLQCRGCSAATAFSCGTVRTWTRRTQSPTGRARTAATRCCATVASTAPAAAGPRPAPSTARPSPWVRPRSWH